MYVDREGMAVSYDQNSRKWQIRLVDTGSSPVVGSGKLSTSSSPAVWLHRNCLEYVSDESPSLTQPAQSDTAPAKKKKTKTKTKKKGNGKKKANKPQVTARNAAQEARLHLEAIDRENHEKSRPAGDGRPAGPRARGPAAAPLPRPSPPPSLSDEMWAWVDNALGDGEPLGSDTFQSVHSSLRPSFQRVVGFLFPQMVSTVPLVRLRAWKLFFLVPRLMLRRPPHQTRKRRGDGPRRIRRIIELVGTSAEDPDFRGLFDDFLKDAAEI